MPTPQPSSITPVNITITWSREDCLVRKGESRHYALHYRLAGSNTIITMENVDLNIRTYTANSLSPDTEYQFDVALVNEVGTGPYTSVNISTSTIEGKLNMQERLYNATYHFLCT